MEIKNKVKTNKGGTMKEQVSILKERVEQLKIANPCFYHHPKLQAANDLLDFATESIDSGDTLQAESSIKCAIRYIERVEKSLEEEK